MLPIQDISAIQPGSQSVIPFVVIFVIGAAVSCIVWRKRIRRGEILNLAAKRNLEYFRWELPYDFPVNLLDDLGSWDKAHNVIAGPYCSDLLLAFDIKCGWGRQSFTRTIVARRASVPFTDLLITPPDLRCWQENRWRVATLNRATTKASVVLRPRFIEHTWDLLA